PRPQYWPGRPRWSLRSPVRCEFPCAVEAWDDSSRPARFPARIAPVPPDYSEKSARPHRPSANGAAHRRPVPGLPVRCCEQLRLTYREFGSAHLGEASNNRRCPQTRHARSPAFDGCPFRHSFIVSRISQSTNRPTTVAEIRLEQQKTEKNLLDFEDERKKRLDDF